MRRSFSGDEGIELQQVTSLNEVEKSGWLLRLHVLLDVIDDMDKSSKKKKK